MDCKLWYNYLKQFDRYSKLFTIFAILLFNQLFGGISAVATKSGTHDVPLYFNNTNSITVTVTLTDTELGIYGSGGYMQLWITFTENGDQPDDDAALWNTTNNFSCPDPAYAQFNGDQGSITFTRNDIEDPICHTGAEGDGFMLKAYLTQTGGYKDTVLVYFDNNANDYQIIDFVDPWLSSWTYPNRTTASANPSGNEYPFNNKQFSFSLGDNLYDYTGVPTGTSYISYVKGLRQV